MSKIDTVCRNFKRPLTEAMILTTRTTTTKKKKMFVIEFEMK